MTADSSGNASPLLSVRVARLFQSVGFWWVLCLTAAAIVGWNERYEGSGDGLSYLDMASYAAAGKFSALINGYWSPGYPAVIAAGIALFHPSPAAEFPFVHLVDFVIQAGVLGSFTFFVGALGKLVAPAIPRGVLVPLAFGIFFWSVYGTGTGFLDPLTPDRLVSAVIFLAAGFCCRIASGRSGRADAVLLGLLLAAGYWVKAAMFPLGLLLTGLLALIPSRMPRRRSQGLVAAGVMLLFSAPLIIPISRHTGHLSMGESGTDNYEWYVNGLPTPWLEDVHDGHGKPLHSPQKLLASPLTIDFAEPIGGTFPLWYEPSYWTAGAARVFHLSNQVNTIRHNLLRYRQLFGHGWPLVAAAVVLFFRYPSGKPAQPFRSLSATLMLWTVFASLMYVCLFVDARYLWGFTAVFWIVLFARLFAGVGEEARSVALPLMLGAILLPCAVELSATAGSILIKLRHGTVSDYILAGDRLKELGLRPGDQIAHLGGWPTSDLFARYNGLRITALIPSAEEYTAAGPAGAARVENALRRADIKALVTDLDFSNLPSGWIELARGDHNYGVLLIPPAAVSNKSAESALP